MQSTILIYSDGSGNNWTIGNDSIVYQPVTPEISSSGTYSGGKAVTKTVSKDEFSKVHLVFEKIISNREIQIQNRIMTSGMLKIKENNRETKMVIIKPCIEKDELEALLNALINE